MNNYNFSTPHPYQDTVYKFKKIERFSSKKFLNDLQTQNLKLGRLNSYHRVIGANNPIIKTNEKSRI